MFFTLYLIHGVIFSAFRSEFLKALNSLGPSSTRGYYINSCYAHCQTGTQETWLRDDSPVLSGTVRNHELNYFKFTFIIHNHKPLYPVKVGVRSAYIPPFSDSTCGNITYWLCCSCCLSYTKLCHSVIDTSK